MMPTRRPPDVVVIRPVVVLCYNTGAVTIPLSSGYTTCESSIIYRSACRRLRHIWLAGRVMSSVQA